MEKKSPRKPCTILLLAGILMLALGLRIVRLNDQFHGNDDVSMLLYLFDSFPNSLNLHSLTVVDNAALGNPLRLIGFPLGALLPVCTAIVMLFYSLCHIPITTITISFIPLCFGLLSIVLAYCVVGMLASPKSALLAALLLAVTPIHCTVSRCITASWTLSLCVQLGVLATLILCLRTNEIRWKCLFSLTCACLIISDNQFVCFLPVVPLAVFAAMDGSLSPGRRLAETIRWFRSHLILFAPAAIVLAGLLGLHIVFTKYKQASFSGVDTGVGSLSHMLLRDSGLGFYAPDAFGKTLFNLGWPLCVLVVAMMIVGLRGKQNAANARLLILPAWGMLFYLPFLFVISPATTLTHGYISAGLYPLIIFAGVMLGCLLDAPGRSTRVTTRFALFVVVIASGLACLSSSAGYPVPGLFGTAAFQGSYEESTGHKAAGCWLRMNTPDTAGVYVSGGVVKLMRFYAKRHCYGFFDTKYNHMDRAYFREVTANVDYAVISPSQRAVTEESGFSEIIRFMKDDRCILSIYSRQSALETAAPIILDAREWEKSFDNTYNRIADFVNIPRYTTRQVAESGGHSG